MPNGRSKLSVLFEIDLDWQAQADCLSIGPEYFFPDEDDDEAIDRAKRFCASCPVIAACRNHALRYREDDGVWGGLSAKDRRRILRVRRKAERS